MAKKLYNVSPGLLILPNGVEITPGTSVDLPKEYADNAGVASWIADGLASESPPQIVVVADLAAVTMERDLLAEQVAELQAQLDAATAPKGE